MRVTQSMLSSNMLRNLNTSYGKMSKYQEMITSGMKITRPSDDPVVAVKGMSYRVELDRNTQYQRNINEAHTWLDSTDEALDQVGTSLIRVKELIIQAANDTNSTDDREKINEEIAQIKAHIRDIGNTKIGDNYIFSGTHTDKALFDENGVILDGSNSGLDGTISINVFEGIPMQLNTQGNDLFGNIDNFMSELQSILENPNATSSEISDALGATMSGEPALAQLTEDTLSKRANVGARQNRVELMENRLDLREVNVTKQMSINEDTDYAKTISDMTVQESIHQAALSVGAKIIQTTLVDFIR